MLKWDMWNCWSKIAPSQWSGFFQTSYVKASHYFHLKFCFFLRCISGLTKWTHGESKFSGCHYKVKGLTQDVLIVLKFSAMHVSYGLWCMSLSLFYHSLPFLRLWNPKLCFWPHVNAVKLGKLCFLCVFFQKKGLFLLRHLLCSPFFFSFVSYWKNPRIY